MAAELQPPVLGNNNNNNNNNLITNPIPGTAQNVQLPSANTSGPILGPKRNRRPSVRLGEIGDQPATLRTSKPWRLNPNRESNPNKPSKIRPLTNLVTPVNGNFDYSSAETTTTANNNGNISHRKFPFKAKRPTTSTNSKRVRTNFTVDQSQEEQQQQQQFDDDDDDLEDRVNGVNNHDFNEFNPEDDDDDCEEGFRDFDPEINGPGPGHDPLQSPVNSADDVGVQQQRLDIWHAHNRRSIRGTRVSNSNHDLGLESNSRNQGMGLDDGVRKWLMELGLARYAPVFEIHEVDDEVLPHLTHDDLKDMGINAVGSRRKLYSAIQKLRKGLS